MGRLVAGGRLVGAGLLIVALLAVAAADLVPVIVKARGEKALVVVSGSMRPTFQAGDLVVVGRPVASGLRAGMVVAFHAPGSPQRLTTHRIYRLQPKPYGLFVQTKGDANAAPDPDFTPASDITGVMQGRLPHVGRLISLVQSPLGRVLLLALPLMLIAVAQTRELLRGPRGPRSPRPPAVPRRPRRRPRRQRLLVNSALLVAVGGIVAVAGTSLATFNAQIALAANQFQTTAFCPSASTYASTVLGDSPSLYYRLADTATPTAVDSAAAPTNGTYRGSPTLAAGGAIKCDTNKAVSLDGSTAYVSSAKLITNPTTFTLEAWFNTSVGGGRIIGFGNTQTGASTSYDRHVYLTDAGQLVFGVYTAAAVTLVSPSSYIDGRWHLVNAVLNSASGMSLYVDGALVNSNTTKTAQNYNGYWRVGYDNLAGWGTTTPTRFFYTGLLDDVAVYNTALTTAKISAHYAANHS